MAWQGIWFEHAADEGKAHSPEWFQGLVPPIAYPYAHNFIEGEEKRLKASRDPSVIRREGELFTVYYSLNHDGGQSGIDQQGCHVLHWLFENFARDSSNTLSARFSEIPVVIHSNHPAKAAALGNALTLLRFLGAREDQAVAKIMIHPWDPTRGNVRLAALDYEKRVLEFLHGDVLYPEGVTLFDVLARNDLKAHRELPVCCRTEIGFVGPLLEWIDECWPQSESEGSELRTRLVNSLEDEAKYFQARRRPATPDPMQSFR